MTDTIKITSLGQMGTTIPGSSLTPIVDMSGTPTTKKATIANIANAILSQAGNTYAYAAKANLANTAGSAGTVSNASQPNITSVGTLTSLTVAGTTNLGPVGNITITGGTTGQVLTTNGSNVLSWTTVSAGNNDPAGSNTQLQFNDGGDFGGSANLTFNKTTNNLSITGNVIAQGGVYSNVISSIGDSNVELWVNHPGGFNFVFTNGGALQIPGGHVLETDGEGSFELKSGNGIVISSDIGNTNQHFSFRTDGVFHAPSNVELEGTRLSIGPGAANVYLLAPTVVVNANSNVYVQAALTNENANGSADWVAYGTNGDDTGGWTDFGFTGYNFNDPSYTITGPGDGYLFAHAYSNGTGGGNLVLATGDHGTSNDIVFATNGFAEENEFGRISDANNALELTRANSTIKFSDGTVIGVIEGANTFGFYNNNSNTQFLFEAGNVIWSFDGGANTLTLPNDGVIDNSDSNFEVRGIENVNFEANSVVNIYTDASGNAYQWQFGDDGNLILAGGSSVIQSIANSSLDPLNPNVSTMVLTPDPNYYNQALVLDPTAPGHIHLRAPSFSGNIDDPYANIFLGGETSSFEVGAATNPNVFVHSGGNTWTFDNTGTLTLPGEGVIRSNDDTVVIQSYDTGNAVGKGIRVGTNGFLYFEDSSTGWLSIENVADNAMFKVPEDSYVRIASNNEAYNWYFEADGNLTLPGNNIAINYANGIPIFDSMVQWTTAPVSNTSAGTAGQAAYDAGGNLFVCVATNTWSRFSGTTSW